jgi:ParB-like chromosome segregation protein Spo0J
MSKFAGSLLQEKLKIELQLATGKPQPHKLPSSLSLGKIKVIPEVFQHRKHVPWKSEPHIKTLAKVIASNQSIEPITVWWGGKHWICIDGHHRLEAYKVADSSLLEIPVRVFEGTIDEALKEAAAGNSRDKLGMTSSEKLDAAWRLTISSDTLSKADVVKATGVSEGSVAAMRRAKNHLLADRPNRDLSEMNWLSARDLANGKEVEAINWDEKLEKDAEKLAAILAKNLPPDTRKSPELFARAIEIYDTRMADALSEYWNTHENEEIEL